MHGGAIQPEHITKKNGSPRAFYIGIVVGAPGATIGTLKHLGMEMDRLCRKHKIVKVFARPMTIEGLRLSRKNGFKNVINGGQPEMNFVCYKNWEYTRLR